MLEFIPFGFGVFFIVALIFLLVLVSKSFYLVRQAESVVIERFGCYERVMGPGLHFVIPFIERPRTVIWSFVKEVAVGRYQRFTHVLSKIDLRESVYDFPKQNVITKDNVTMEINALLYYQITDPKAAVYEAANLPEAIEKLTQTTLRNVIGSLDLDESLVSRDRINEKLREILDEATDKWGVKVNRVELQEVNPPSDIRHAMEKQMRAERDRRARILESEGMKSAAILEAEGIQESQILRARGEAESQVLRAKGEAESCVIQAEGEAAARLKMAQAEAQALGLVQQALPKGDPTSYLIAMQYIKALPELTKGHDNKLIVVPYEASSLIGSLSTVKTLFNETK